jgi:hypothetical protein
MLPRRHRLPVLFRTCVFQDKGLIRIGHSQIQIVDVAKPVAAACESHVTVRNALDHHERGRLH